MNGWKRFLAGVVLSAVTTANLAACSSSSSDDEVGHRRPAPGTVKVSEGKAAGASIDGLVSVELPGDSIRGSGTLSVTESGAKRALESPLVGGDAPVVAIEMSGASLVGPATLSFTTTGPPDMPGGAAATPVVVTWDEKAERWTEQPSLYDAATHRVVIQTDHFSLWSWSWPSRELIRPLGDGVAALAGSRASQPRCDNEDAARGDGWSVTSDDGDRIMWCFGIENGRRVVRVANNRPYPVALTYDGNAFTLTEGPEHDVSVYSLYRSLLEAQGSDSTTPQVALPAGATLTLEVTDAAAGGTFGIKTEWDGLAMFAEALDLWWHTVLLAAGTGDTATASERFVEAVTGSDCIRSGILGDGGLNQATSLDASLDAIFHLLRTCGPDLAKITAGTAGQANPIYGIVNWLTNTLISALRQLLGDAYAAADILASPTGDARYRIAVAQLAPQPQPSKDVATQLRAFVAAWASPGSDLSAWAAPGADIERFSSDAQLDATLVEPVTIPAPSSEGRVEILVDSPQGGYSQIYGVTFAVDGSEKLRVTGVHWAGDAG